MINQGAIVTIKPEYRDDGDELFIWVAVDNESKGRITLQTQITATLIKTEIFQVSMLETV